MLTLPVNWLAWRSFIVIVKALGTDSRLYFIISHFRSLFYYRPTTGCSLSPPSGERRTFGLGASGFAVIRIEHPCPTQVALMGQSDLSQITVETIAPVVSNPSLPCPQYLHFTGTDRMGLNLATYCCFPKQKEQNRPTKLCGVQAATCGPEVLGCIVCRLSADHWVRLFIPALQNEHA